MTSKPCSGDGLEPAAPAGFGHIELTYVTTFYFNQTDSSSVAELLRHYASYSGDLLDRLQFVLVDDGSPSPSRSPPILTSMSCSCEYPWTCHGTMRRPGTWSPSVRARTSSC